MPITEVNEILEQVASGELTQADAQKLIRFSRHQRQRDTSNQQQERPWAHRGCSAGWV